MPAPGPASPATRPPWHPDRLGARIPFLRRRALLSAGTRAFFLGRDYTEVETSYAAPCPGEEVHLRAFRTLREYPDGRTAPLWLHTSPEFAMKKLLAGGAGPNASRLPRRSFVISALTFSLRPMTRPL